MTLQRVKSILEYAWFRLCLAGCAAVLLTLFFYRFYHVYDDRLSQSVALAMLCVGLVALVIVMPSGDAVAKRSNFDFVAMAVFATLGLVMPFPANICLMLMLISKVTGLSGRFAQYSAKFDGAAKVLCVSLLLFIVYYLILIPKIYELPGQFAFVFGHLSRLFGFAAMSDGHVLMLHNGSGIVPVAVSMDNLGVLPLLFTTIVFIYCMSFRFRITQKLILCTLCAMLAFIAFRFLLVSSVYANFHSRPSFFWGFSNLVASQVCYAIILIFLAKTTMVHSQNHRVGIRNFSAYSVGLAVGMILIILGFMGEFHSGKRQRNIFIDEYHSYGWASATEPLDRENFGGQRSTYTFTSFVEYLGHFGTTTLITEVENYEMLTPNDILVIKTPTVAFDSSLIEQIHSFVRSGGSLFLIGDHTNLFNMGAHLNQISEEFGIRFNFDSVFHTQTGNLTVFRNTFPFFSSAVVEAVPYYLFATSCSISSSVFARTIMSDTSVTAELLDVSTPHFFGNMRTEAHDLYGIFEQVVSVNYGRGKVTAFSDSTTFSSFSAFMHNNPEFIASVIIDLRDHNNRINLAFKWAGLVATVATIAIILFKRNKCSKVHLGSIVLICFFAVILANALVGFINRRFRDNVMAEVNAIPQIWMLHDRDHTRVSHFISMGSDHLDHSSLFIAFQRMGHFIRQKHDLTALENAKPYAIIVLMEYDLTFYEIYSLQRYLRYGGHVILFSNESINNVAMFNRLFRPHGHVHRTFTEVIIENTSDTGEEQTISLWRKAIHSTYNIRRYIDDDIQNMRAYSFDYGEGRVSVIINLEEFTNARLGNPGIPPTERQIEQHQKLFRLLDFAME